MAEYDGSIRIGMSIDLDDAKKQLEHLKDRMSNQTKEIDQQTQAVRKLQEQYKRLGSTQKVEDTDEFKRLTADIKSAEEELSALNKKYETVKRKAAEKAKWNGGEIDPELLQRATSLKIEITEGTNRLQNMKSELRDLTLNPVMTEEMAKLDGEISAAEERLAGLKNVSAETSAEIERTQAEVNDLTAGLQQLKEGATVADQGILDLQNELADLEKQKFDLEAAGVGLGFQEYDDTVAKIQQISSELKNYRASLVETDSAEESSIGWKDRLSDAMSRLGSLIVGSAKRAGSAVGGLKNRIAGLGREKGFKKAGNAAASFAKRLKTLVAGALIFNVISKGLRALTDQLGKYLTVNKEFSSALSGIKSNLLTAFQPVYEAVLPALNSLMTALEGVTAKFAAFMATVFGTTAQKAQENAEALYEQADATEEAGKSAKKAEKYFASFDTIEQLGSKSAESEAEETKPEFDTDFSEIEPPQWLLDFWSVFEDGWEKYGEATLEKFSGAIDKIKSLLLAVGETFMSIWTGGGGEEVLAILYQILQSIFDIIGNIAETFRKVWEGGAGETLLNTIFSLLKTIFGIISDIAAAFKAAWDSRGEAVVQALSYALNAVLSLLNSIGQAFRTAWNDGHGQQICETILNILKNIFEIVGNLATRLKEAWEANDNGEKIWNSILDIVQDILDFFDEITAATAEWLEGLDLEPIMSSFQKLMDAVEPFIDIILDNLAWAYENILLPLAGWVIEDAAPAAIDALSAAFEGVSEVIKALEPLFSKLWKAIQPVAGFIGDVFVAALIGLGNAISTVCNLLVWLISLPEQVSSNFQKMNGIEKFATIFGVIAGVAGALAVIIMYLSGNLAGVVIGVATVAAGLMSIKASLDSVSKRSINVGSFSADGYSASGYSSSGYSASPRAAFASQLSAYSLSDVPHLADGAVISPNNEFLAVLGDQKNGTNIETPLSTMKQAFLEAISESGLLSQRTGGGGVAEFSIDGHKFARITYPYIKDEQGRVGVSMVEGH